METIQRDLITDLDSVSVAQKELLIAVGYTTVSQLLNKSPKALAEELQKANAKLNIAPISPSVDEIATWFASQTNTLATDFTLKQAEVPTLVLEDELHFAPVAHIVSQEELLIAGIQLEEIPYANKAESNAHFVCCTEENRPTEKSINESLDSILSARKKANTNESSPTKPNTLKIDRVTPSYIRDKTHLPQRSSSKKNSNKGVKDTRPLNTYFGALTSLMTVVSMYAAIICTGFLVFNQDSKLLLIGPAAFLLFGSCYLIWGQRARCCVCHQKQFIRKKRSINKQQAHKFPLLSYVTSTALYATFMGRFRCIICGSSIRLFGKD